MYICIYIYTVILLCSPSTNGIFMELRVRGNNEPMITGYGVHPSAP